MSRNTALLDRISGYFFLAGFVLYRLKNVPVIGATIINLAALAAYLIGYVMWFVATLCYPNQPRRADAWYGFAQFKEQFTAASLLGAMATIFSLVYPTLLLPALWLFTASNLKCNIGEYHKMHNPPQYDPNYSTARQTMYLRYAFLVTSTSALTALACTLALAAPAFAYISLMTAAVIGNFLTIAALYYCQRSTFDTFEVDNVNHTYGDLADQLSFDLAQAPQVSNAPHFERQQMPATRVSRASNYSLSSVDNDLDPTRPCL